MKEASGLRYVQVEVEVPGTTEEVWQAIATGPGISSWFVPTEFEEQDGKPVAVKMHFGPGMEAASTLTDWEPPRMWASQSLGWLPDMPPISHEWSVEPRGEGRCVVRIVQRLISPVDDWDEQLGAVESGWPAFFRTLQIYLMHFRGRRSAMMKLMAPVAGTEAEAWKSLIGAVGLNGVSVGERWTAPADVPAFSGTVEHYTERPNDALLRIDQPAPGIAALGTIDCGGPILVAICFYLYGDQATETVARETPLWQAWFQKRFPTESAAGKRE